MSSFKRVRRQAKRDSNKPYAASNCRVSPSVSQAGFVVASRISAQAARRFGSAAAAIGQLHQRFGVGGDELRQARRRQQRCADARCPAVAADRRHRHALPQRLARRRAAVVGPRVEGQIDRVVGLQKLKMIGRAQQFQSLRGNAVPGESLGKMLPVGRRTQTLIPQQQPAAGRLLQEPATKARPPAA